jgi:hypothetical protein
MQRHLLYVRLGIGLLIVLLTGTGAWLIWYRTSDRSPRPLSVPDGDQEIAWIHNSTAGDTWSLFVIGMKRAEMPVDGVPSGLIVDDSNAFPGRTTAVPELVVSRAGFSGNLRIRWYKVAGGASVDEWVRALGKREPAPLAIIGGSTSDRAQELAFALRRQATAGWHGDPPLLLITTATVDTVPAEALPSAMHASGPAERNLVDVYEGRSFRFCFSNSQMVRAVSDFLMQEPTLRPGSASWPGLRLVGAAAAGITALMPQLADMARPPTVFPLQWKDDPYSGDLYNQFREQLHFTFAGDRSANRALRFVQHPDLAIPFSTGGFSRPNTGETKAVHEVLRELPPLGERSLLVIPTVGAPARRVLLALSERTPQVGRRLVAITGDGISVNTFYRDAEWAWPARSIPIPVVFFTHHNPFGWDSPDDTTPPAGYRLEPKTTTEEVLLDTTLGRAVADAVFPQPLKGQPNRMIARADEVAAHLRSRPDKFFDDRGNRRGLSGEHVGVLRPTVRYGLTALGQPRPDATIEVYRREDDGLTWSRVGAVQVLPERPDSGSPGE